MFGRFLTSVLWGILADHYGRKPVILFGTITVLVLTTAITFLCNFLSSSLHMLKNFTNIYLSLSTIVMAGLFSTHFLEWVQTSGWQLLQDFCSEFCAVYSGQWGYASCFDGYKSLEKTFKLLCSANCLDKWSANLKVLFGIYCAFHNGFWQGIAI